MNSPGYIAALTDRPIVMNDYLLDGTVWHTAEALVIGRRPLTLMEQVGREARLAVRRGMADVLVWLGERVYNEPTSEEILRDIRALAKGESRGKHAAA